jgi:hypothetical protein
VARVLLVRTVLRVLPVQADAVVAGAVVAQVVAQG